MNNLVNAVNAHSKKKEENKYLLSKDQWNQNYYFTLFQSFIFYIDSILRNLILAARVLSGKNQENRKYFN